MSSLVSKIINKTSTASSPTWKEIFGLNPVNSTPSNAACYIDSTMEFYNPMGILCILTDAPDVYITKAWLDENEMFFTVLGRTTGFKMKKDQYVKAIDSDNNICQVLKTPVYVMVSRSKVKRVAYCHIGTRDGKILLFNTEQPPREFHITMDLRNGKWFKDKDDDELIVPNKSRGFGSIVGLSRSVDSVTRQLSGRSSLTSSTNRDDDDLEDDFEYESITKSTTTSFNDKSLTKTEVSKGTTNVRKGKASSKTTTDSVSKYSQPKEVLGKFDCDQKVLDEVKKYVKDGALRVDSVTFNFTPESKKQRRTTLTDF